MGINKSIEIIIAKFVKIVEDKVQLKCLLDFNSKKNSLAFQIRNFDIEVFPITSLKKDNYLAITIITEKGNRVFQYDDLSKCLLFDDMSMEAQQNILNLIFNNNFEDYNLANTLINLAK